MIRANENIKDGVSVVVPFHNRSRFLKRLLDSIENQTLSPEQIFIVDNGSNLEETNAAWDIIQSHELFSKCSFSSSMKSGNANYARNLGYYLSETRYVAFLDSDDWWEKDHLKESVYCLENSHKDAVYSGARIHTRNGFYINKSIDVNTYDNPFELILSPSGYIAQTSSYVVNKQSIDEHVMWDESLKRHQDFDYFAAIFYKTSGWSYCLKVNVNIDWDDGGTDKREVDIRSLMRFYEKWETQIPDHIKKYYLKSVYMSIYKQKIHKKYKDFYKKKIKDNSGLGDFKNFIYINGYIHGRISVISLVDFFNLRFFIKKIMKRN